MSKFISTIFIGSLLVAASAAGAYSVPLPSSFSPKSGPPGTVITIPGKGFTGLTAVWIGAAHNSKFTVVSDALLLVTVPATATTAHIGYINPQYAHFSSTNFTVTTAVPPANTGSIAGTVLGPNAATLRLTGPTPLGVTAGLSGDYSFAQLAPGLYTVTPTNPGIVFTPTSIAVTVGTTGVTNLNFRGVPTSLPTYIVSGTVSGTLKAGVLVTITGSNVGSVATDAGGAFSFPGLASGNYTVNASLHGYSFTPSKLATVTTADSVSNNFTSRITPAGAGLALTLLSPLPPATVGEPYAVVMDRSISGGVGINSYQSGSFGSGTPPEGMVVSVLGSLTGVPTIAGTYPFQVCATDAVGNLTVACVATTVTVGPANANSPDAALAWVYYNGAFNWGGDYSFVVNVDYNDTSGVPVSGTKDIKVSLTGAWGGWLPYSPNWNFDSDGYGLLVMALKPTVANQKWHVYFVAVGDVPVGNTVDPTLYGPKPVVGQWGRYYIPLSDLGIVGQHIYKFCIQDQTGLSSNVWYVDNVGFEYSP